MVKDITISIRFLIVMMVVLGGIYPIAVAGVKGYDPLASGGSNIAASARKEKNFMLQRAQEFRKDNGLSVGTEVSMEMLCASGSGLDPDISPGAAKLQADRIARAKRAG